MAPALPADVAADGLLALVWLAAADGPLAAALPGVAALLRAADEPEAAA